MQTEDRNVCFLFFSSLEDLEAFYFIFFYL